MVHFSTNSQQMVLFDFNSKQTISNVITPIFITIEHKFQDQALDSKNLNKYFALGFRDLKRIEPGFEQELDNLLSRINLVLSNETEKRNASSFKETVTEKLYVELGLVDSGRKPILIDADGVAHLPESVEKEMMVVDLKQAATLEKEQQQTSSPPPSKNPENKSSSTQQFNSLDEKQHEKAIDEKMKKRQEGEILNQKQELEREFLKKCYDKKD